MIVARHEVPGSQLRPIIPYPTGRFFRGTLSQALRASCPSGTKAIRPSKGLALSWRLWGNPGLHFHASSGPPLRGADRCLPRTKLAIID